MEHFSNSIGGWFDFQEAYQRIVARLPADQPSTIVEVGVWLGCSTAYLGVEIVNSGKPITLVAVDHFLGSPELLGEAALPTLEAACRANLAPLADALGERFRLVVSDSVSAAANCDDYSVDVVWIDANHEYDAVRADIEAWWPKLRVGGVMAGHDASTDGVQRAIEERFGTGTVDTTGVWWAEKEVA